MLCSVRYILTALSAKGNRSFTSASASCCLRRNSWTCSIDKDDEAGLLLYVSYKLAVSRSHSLSRRPLRQPLIAAINVTTVGLAHMVWKIIISIVILFSRNA